MNELKHSEPNVKLKVSTAVLLRNKFLAFGKTAVDRFPLDLSTFLPVPPKFKQRNFQPLATAHDSKRLLKDVLKLPLEQRLFDNADYAVFYAKAFEMPRLMDEIGRLREEAFRQVGEGTGRSIDVDVFDTYYDQLFVWHKANQEVVGAYRIGRTDDILKAFGKKGLYTSTLFKFKKAIFEKLGPALEMGRSFVRPEYQRTPFALFLLWKGIGQYVLRHPQYKILFGPVSISNEYSALSRQLMVEYLKANVYETELARLVKPRNPFPGKAGKPAPALTRNLWFRNLEDVSSAIAEIEGHQQGIPVLLKQYLKLGAKAIAFTVDAEFCDSLDCLIVVDLMTAERRMLEKLMGEDCASAFLSKHQNQEAA
jgi:putative hemolysin